MGAYDTPSCPCPYCKSMMEADFVDVGVGMVQCGPYRCDDCFTSEIGPEWYDWCYKDRKGNTIYLEGKYEVLKPGHPFSEKEVQTKYYEPHAYKVSPYANTVGGELVDHVTAKKMYDRGLLDEKRI